MKETEKVYSNTNGKLPENSYDILRVKGIDNPEEVLSIIKQTVSTVLENKKLSSDSNKWYKLLPKMVVAFTTQLDDEDYKDELVTNIHNLVHLIQERRKWEWYSSKLTETGFDIVVTEVLWVYVYLLFICMASLIRIFLLSGTVKNIPYLVLGEMSWSIKYLITKNYNFKNCKNLILNMV